MGNIPHAQAGEKGLRTTQPSSRPHTRVRTSVAIYVAKKKGDCLPIGAGPGRVKDQKKAQAATMQMEAQKYPKYCHVGAGPAMVIGHFYFVYLLLGVASKI